MRRLMAPKILKNKIILNPKKQSNSSLGQHRLIGQKASIEPEIKYEGKNNETLMGKIYIKR